MADIELVIKISEEMYKWVNDVNKFFDAYGISDFIDLVKNGIPLSKGHGDIVDIETLIDMFWDGNSMEITKYDLSVIDPIIEADKS